MPNGTSRPHIHKDRKHASDVHKYGQGLFFYHTKKVGLGVGVKWGAGVLVTHILDEDGKESWSAPVLYKVHEVSLGLLAGAGSVPFIVPFVALQNNGTMQCQNAQRNC